MQTDLIYQYILNHIDAEPDVLKRISRKAHLELLYTRMLSGHLQGRILYMLTRMIKPKHVLELGTFAGYSALCMAEAMDQNGVVDTIEVNDEMEDFIREAFSCTPLGSRIVLHIGDALQIIPTLNHSYDLVLLDANKRNYCEYYDAVFDKLNPGGIILADNVLWDGKVVQEVEPSDLQTIGIRKFNDKVMNDPRIEKVILPVRDGLTIIRKKENVV